MLKPCGRRDCTRLRRSFTSRVGIRPEDGYNPVVDLEATLRFLKALQDEGVRYALVGGLAMIVHGRVRATRDVDIFIAVDETNIELLKTALRALFDDPSIEEITATDLAGD